MFEKKISHSLEETNKIAKNFAKILKPGEIVLFYGELGAGKTEFIKAICDYYAVEQIVTSPTFTIVNQYFGKLGKENITIFHIDLYRIEKKEELIEIGFMEYISNTEAIKFVEWAENSYGFLDKCNYSIKITNDEDDINTRHITLSSEGKMI